MANKFQVEIQETVEELEHRLERAITSVSKEKLLLLYWIATKKIKTREELATMLKRDESTIYRWLRTYKQGGITSLLTVKKAPGKTSHIPPEVREKLIEKLQEPEGETSYGKLQMWLENRYRVISIGAYPDPELGTATASVSLLCYSLPFP